MKNVIMQVTYLLNGPMFNLLFYIYLYYFIMRETTLPLESKLSGKFQRFSAIDGGIKKLKKS